MVQIIRLIMVSTYCQSVDFSILLLSLYQLSLYLCLQPSSILLTTMSEVTINSDRQYLMHQFLTLSVCNSLCCLLI